MTDTEELVGQGDENTESGTEQSGSLSEGAAPTSTTDENPVIKELQDRLSQAGRRAQQAEQTATQLAARLADTDSKLEAIGAKLTRDEENRMAAYLATLPPEEREREELKIKVAKLESRQSEQGSETGSRRTLTLEERQHETRTQAAQMAQAASVEFGLDNDEQVQPDDPRLDWSTRDTYYASVRRLARKISLGQAQPTAEGASVADTTAKKGTPRGSAASSPDLTKLAQETAKIVLSELQAQQGGAPNSARPAPTPVVQSSDDPHRNILMSKQPVRAQRDALKKQLAADEAAFAKTVR